MPSECTFHLSGREEELFYAGEDFVEGYVTLRNTSAKYYTQMKLRFRGKAKCGYNKMDDNPRGSPHGVYLQSKYIITKGTKVLDNVSGVLKAGTHSWPFRFLVDEDCPTSVEGRSGHIRYELCLKIYNKEKYNNIFIKPITVINEDNLNWRSDCKRTIEVPVRSTIPCRLFHANPHFHLRVRHGGYAPGQFLLYSLDLQQECIQEYKIKFIRKSCYRVDNPLSDENVQEIIFAHKFHLPYHLPGSPIENGFVVPCTPPTMDTKYISIQYFLAVSAKVPCCISKLKAELKVHIGTIPLREALSPEERRCMVEYFAGDPENFTIRPYRLDRIDPSYIPFVDIDNEPINRVDGFRPAYPMYNYARDTY